MNAVTLFKRPATWFQALRRQWAAFTQPGTGGLVQPGDWRCVYKNGEHTYWMSHGDAKNCKELWGGRLEWRKDVGTPWHQ